MSARPKTFQHPLQILFNNKRVDHTYGMNWLQEHGHISDNAVTLEDVCREDAMECFYKAFPQNRPKIDIGAASNSIGDHEA